VFEARPLADHRVLRTVELHAQEEATGARGRFVRLDAPDWVNVIPLAMVAGADGVCREHVVMVRQFRHGAGEVTLEVPGGMVDPGELPAAAAARELAEETGWQAGRIERLGSVRPNPALFANTLHTFVAHDCTLLPAEARPHAVDSHEHTVVELIELAAIDELLRTGAIDHALVVVAFSWLRLRRG